MMSITISSVTYHRYDENTWTVIMTVLFFPLLVQGFTITLPYEEESATTMSTTFIISTTGSQDSDAIYLWVPLIIVIIFAVIITSLIIVGRQTRRANCKCLGIPSSLDSTPEEMTTNPRRNLTLNINLPVNSTDPIVPETPPPSYAVISRQISSISTITQTSSQIEIPPGYDEAFAISDGTDHRTKRRGSQQHSVRGSVSSQTQISKSSSASRFRLFSRSSSASESSRRPALLRQTSTPQEFRGLGLPGADPVLELPELEHSDVALSPATLDIIHESSSGMLDVHLDNHYDNNGVSRFYIDESEIVNDSTS